MAKSARYQPLKEIVAGGIIVMKDTQSDQPENIVETVKGKTKKLTFVIYCCLFFVAGGPVKEEEQQEPEPPEPFEWSEE